MTSENKAAVNALKMVKEVQWVGEVKHNTISAALTAINLFGGANSGWYNPTVTRINGLIGCFMINQDGSLHFESRIIKMENGKFKIEHLSNEGYLVFEEEYFKSMEKSM